MVRILRVGNPRKKRKFKKLSSLVLPALLFGLTVLTALYILVFGLPGFKSTAAPTTPLIDSLQPFSGSVGEKVIIKGTGFTETGNNILLTAQDSMPGYISNLESKNGKRLEFTVPDGLDLCPPGSEEQGIPCPPVHPQTTAGVYQIEVHNSQGESNASSFTVEE